MVRAKGAHQLAGFAPFQKRRRNSEVLRLAADQTNSSIQRRQDAAVRDI